ncbi:PQ-loop repeat-containing protein 1 [Trichoderma ghanense]|uniref:PQ-loop repeat-containing protein 1 n=1 Tax=Trichoderma ghanense TaxID=65468 RepID=A0ABY2H9G6_9HYPO
MSLIATCVGYLTPIFIILSPILSYGDQAVSMHRKRTSAGFSLDIPLIMLIASLFRIFYWPGARFDSSLLIQSLIMVGMQIALLKIALDHRPSPSNKGGEAGLPFAAPEGLFAQRPYNFWQWRSPKPYWQFILYLFLGLLAGEVVMSSISPGFYPTYSVLVGYIGLGVEATLPIPQILANLQSRSCKGFRVSVLASWLGGDAMKLFWFFTATSEIPLAFKICGIFQAVCDCFLGIQYLMYGSGESAVKEHPLQDVSAHETGAQPQSRSMTPTRRSAPFSDYERK